MVRVEPVAKMSDEPDVRVADSNVCGVGDAEQRRQNVRQHRIIKTTRTRVQRRVRECKK